MGLDQEEARGLPTFVGRGERIQPLLSQLHMLNGEADQLLVNARPVNGVLPLRRFGWFARQEPICVTRQGQLGGISDFTTVEPGLHMPRLGNAAFNVNDDVRGIYVLASMP